VCDDEAIQPPGGQPRLALTRRRFIMGAGRSGLSAARWESPLAELLRRRPLRSSRHASRFARPLGVLDGGFARAFLLQRAERPRMCHTWSFLHLTRSTCVVDRSRRRMNALATANGALHEPPREREGPRRGSSLDMDKGRERPVDEQLRWRNRGASVLAERPGGRACI